ncbi:MAG TPA: ATP-binding protein [Gemmatimonadaceae bacterium]
MDSTSDPGVHFAPGCLEWAIERERALAEFLPDAYLVTDRDGVIRGTNAAAGKLLARSPRALIASRLEDALAPGDRTKLRARLKRLAEGVGADRMHVWRMRLGSPAGEGLRADFMSRAVRDQDGRVSFVRWLVRSVENEMGMSPRPGESRAPDRSSAGERSVIGSRLVANASALLAHSFDLDRTLSGVARLALPVLGDHCWLDVVQQDGMIHRSHLVARDAETPDSHHLEMAVPPRTRDTDNMVVRVIDSASPLLDADLAQSKLPRLAADEGQLAALRALRPVSVMIVPMIARGRVFGAMTFLMAESHRHHQPDDLVLAEELAQRAALAADNARLYFMSQRASQVKDEFMASMSHELRTPLTAIIGYAELLGEEIVGPLNATQKEQLSRVRASGNLLLALVDQVLDLARVDAGKQEPRLTKVSAAAIVEQAVTLISSQLRQKNLALTVKAPAPNVELVTDPLWLRQILVNLLNNAVKFTERGEVGLAAARDGAWISFEVWDTGIGIRAELLDRVFDPFWQAEQGITRRYGGAGVGLPVAHRLCLALGGDITVSSTPGVGSRFVVRVPLGIEN